MQKNRKQYNKVNKIFCVDIGNSTISIGIFEKNEIITSFRFATNKEFLSTEYQLMINSVLHNKEILKSDFTGAIVSSTVPALLNNFELAINDVFGFSPMIVGPGIKTGLNMRLNLLLLNSLCFQLMNDDTVNQVMKTHRHKLSLNDGA